tara:strand:+ start:192 stop:827 length:636 start_codon:yes stop_codon:yes gene_type:complete
MKELQQIQAELKAPKNQYNSFGKYNYRSCEDILEALKPLLKKYDCLLSISDEVKNCGEYTYIESTATLSLAYEQNSAFYEDITNGKTVPFVSASGVAGIEKAGGMALPQAFGSASSYARKYALNGLFLIDDTKDVDATNTHGKEPAKKAAPKSKPKPMADNQLATISALMIELDLTDEQFKKAMGKPITEVNFDEADAAIKRLEALKDKNQ